MPELDNGLDTENSTADVAGLRAQLARANAERDAERARANVLDGQVRQGARQVAESQVVTLAAQERQAEREVGQLTAEIEALTAKRTELLQEGKFEEEGQINLKLNEAIALRQRSESARQHWKNQREIAQNTPADPVERFLAQGSFNDAEKDWIRRNPRYATDQAFSARVNEAHAEAEKNGIARNSPEYFQALEQAGYQRDPTPPARRGDGGNAAFDEPGEGSDASPFSAAGDTDGEFVEQRPAPRQQTRSGGGAAPPSRRATPIPGGARQGPEARLTPDQAQAAIAMSEYFPEDVQNEGEAGIYAYYAKLMKSPMATRLKEQWAAGG